jgi:amidohydrolase
MDKAAIKQKVCEAIAAHRADIEAISEAILAEPELGFKEVKTSRKVQEALERLGIEFTAGHGITGVKARMKGRNSKRTVAMLAELDAIVCRNHRNADPVTGAAHCCGHNIQIANMIAVACGLRDVMSELDGDVVLFAVPAEEYVEIDWRNARRDEGRLKYLGGKQQLIAEGAFEDIDMAMQMHVASGDEFNLGASSNGFIGKLIEYHGRPAHAAFAPEEGINALNAAMMGVMGVNAIRETFRDQDHVRFHPIINAGGDLVNVIPDYVKMESYVRASNIDAMARYNKAVDRALRAGGDAIGAKCEIRNLPGSPPTTPSAKSCVTTPSNSSARRRSRSANTARARPTWATSRSSCPSSTPGSAASTAFSTAPTTSFATARPPSPASRRPWPSRSSTCSQTARRRPTKSARPSSPGLTESPTWPSWTTSDKASSTH